jgi:hypothetical protein
MPRVASVVNINKPKSYGYDIRLDENFYRSAVGPERQMIVQSSDVSQGQQVNVKQNPEDFTSNLGRIYSRNNFSAGQGLDTAHRANGKPDDINRFWDSKGIDVFHGDDETSYQIHLLFTTATQSLSFSGTNNYVTQTTNGDVYVTDTTNIHKYNGSSWSTIAAGTSGASHNFTGIAAFGNGFYATTANSDNTASQLIKFDGSSYSTLTTAQSSSGGLTGVYYVKNRLFITGNDGTAEYIWEKSPFDAWNTANLADADSIVEVEPTHSFTGVVDGGAVVLAASTDGTIYSFKLSSGVFVNQGQTKIPFEEVHSIAATEGIIFIGTKEISRDVGRFYKLDLVTADNLYVLANRQLIKEWVISGINTTPKAMFVSRDSVYLGVKEATNEVNLWRYYLPTGGIARDLQTNGNGFVEGIVQSNGKFIIAVTGSDAYKETSTFESTGYLIASAADFFTAESKQFVGAEISTFALEDGTSVNLDFSTKFEALDNPDDASFTNALTQVVGTGDIEKQISQISRYIIPKIILNSDGTNTPKVKSIQFRALARPELVVAQIPINISDRVERPGRKPVKVKGLGDALYSNLKSKEGTSTTLEIFELNEIIRGVVEKVTYPIIGKDNIGSDTSFAVITVRGTRQIVTGDVSSLDTLGMQSLGIIKFGG